MSIYNWQKAEEIINTDKWIISEIVEQSTTNEEKWFWYYWGLEHGIDVTQDSLYAINSETGEEYDDYGRAEIAGYEGIALPIISAIEQTNDSKPESALSK